MTNLEVALDYVRMGWKVLPVVENGKIPATAHGVKDATNDIDKITDWWTRNPNFNIGVAAGEASGIIVYDIDPRNGGEDSWQQWLKEHGDVPDGIMALTAGGGQHYIARYQQGIRSCKLRTGIDLLSDGRYFVAYPSTIDGRSYQWEGSSDPFDGVLPFDIPSNWYDSMSKRTIETTVNAVGDIIKGDRNNGLTSLAGSMRHLGMKENEILKALLEINDTRCSPPLPESEVRQISRSVSRYEIDYDVAVDTALGSEAAEMLLANLKAEQGDYYFTKASSFLSQPAPMEWVIKGWIPTHSVSMIFGESGVGKSFIALDMACSIATGNTWQGTKTKHGNVVYLAGEGNYGIRQRIASWCKKHDVHSLDNLLISNKPIDLDADGSAFNVIQAVRDISTDDISMVFIDTLNNHMSGDENSAQDTRRMINASKLIASALNSSVAFIHHTGLNGKDRSRGSSAWKGSLDSSIIISRVDEEGTIEINCTKMKDAEEPEPMFGKLEYVELGWTDEDGEEIKGAAFEMCEAVEKTEKPKKESKVTGYMKTFTNAWVDSKCDLNNNNPYISNSALRDFLVKEGIYQDGASVRNQLSASRENSFIRVLIDSQLIKSIIFNNKVSGYEVVNNDFSSQLLLLKSVS